MANNNQQLHPLLSFLDSYKPGSNQNPVINAILSKGNEYSQSAAGQFFQGNYGNVIPALQKTIEKAVVTPEESKLAAMASLKKSRGEKLTPQEEQAVSIVNQKNMNMVMGAINPAGAEGKVGAEVVDGAMQDVKQLTRRGGVAPGEVGPPGYLAPKKPTVAGAEPNYGFDNQATAPIQDVAAPQQPITPQAKPANPITSRIPFLNSSPKSPVRIVLDPSIGAPAREKAVQQTVDTLVPGSTATEKYTNLQPTMDNLGQQIQTVMKNDPKTANITEIMGNYDKNLQSEGVYRNSDITGNTSQKRDAIQKQAQSYITDLYNSARGETSDVVPSNISDQSLYTLKQQINADASSIFKKINNGTTLTDKDRVVLAARQTIDDTLTQLHPEVKQLTTTQSHLYDAKDSLFKGREAEIKTAANNPTGWGKLGSILKNPAVIAGASGVLGASAGGIGGLAGAGISAVPALFKNFTDGMNKNPDTNTNNNGGNQEPSQGVKTINQENGVVVHEGMVSQGSNGVNRYEFTNDPFKKDANGNSQVMDTSGYVQRANQLDTQIANAQATGNPVALAQLQGQRKVLDNTFAGQKDLRDAWNGSADNPGVGSTLKVASQAYTAVGNAGPDFYNALNGGYDKLLTASNGKYAKMAKYLEYLSHATGTDFTKAGSKEALQGQIDAAVNATKSNWDNLQQGYSGAPEPGQTSSPVLNKILTPSVTQAPQRAQMPAGGFGGDGGLTGHSGLDSILQAAR